eukprot:scaffold125753_cov21-Tisochrysis_lutea.AAC.1
MLKSWRCHASSYIHIGCDVRHEPGCVRSDSSKSFHAQPRHAGFPPETGAGRSCKCSISMPNGQCPLKHSGVSPHAVRVQHDIAEISQHATWMPNSRRVTEYLPGYLHKRKFIFVYTADRYSRERS